MVQASVAANELVRDEDRLLDPCNDRVINIKPPPIVPLSKERIFPGGSQSPNSAINAELVKNYLFEGGKVSKDALCEIMRRARTVLSAEPNLVRVEGRVVIVGDIHG